MGQMLDTKQTLQEILSLISKESSQNFAGNSVNNLNYSSIKNSFNKKNTIAMKDTIQEYETILYLSSRAIFAETCKKNNQLQILNLACMILSY